MKQPQLIIEYVREHGSILPAKMGGKIWKDQMFGSETSKRCRELRDLGQLESEQDGRFERYWLKGRKPVMQDSSVCCYSYKYFKTHTKDCAIYEVMESQAKVLVDHRQRELGLLKK